MPKADVLKARIGLSGPAWQRIDSAPPVIPDHELLRRIGHGSYGEVWLARNAVGTARAVKIVYRDSFKDPRPYEREFKGIQKYEPLSRSNDGLVDVLQIGRNDPHGYFYYVMELADDANSPVGTPSGAETGGGSLEVANGTRPAPPSSTPGSDPGSYVPRTLADEIRRRGRLPVDACLELGLTIGLALGHLHRHGLIHRDVKPSNIIFVNGVPKLADIGLVTAVEEANTFVGTEGFVPPEGPNSAQADLFALGKALYEASMGKDRQEFPEPFTKLAVDAESMELMELNTILLKACATQPSDRYGSAEEMNADLALLHSGKSVVRHHATERRLAHLKRFSLAGATLALLLTGGWLYQSWHSQRLAKLAAENLALAQLAQQGAEASRQSLRQLEVNHGLQAMEAGDYAQSMLWFAEALKPVSDADTERAYRFRLGTFFRYSPKLVGVYHHDGRKVLVDPDEDHVLTFRKLSAEQFGEMQAWDLATGEARFNLHTINFLGLRPSLDGRWLITATARDKARVVDVSSGGVVGVSLPHRMPMYRTAISPDGARLVGGMEDCTVRILEVSTGNPIGLPLAHSNLVTFAEFSPDGTRVVTCSGAGLEDRHGIDQDVARVWDARTGEPLTGWLEQNNPIAGAWFSPNGRRVVTLGLGASSLMPVPDEARVWDAHSGRLLYAVRHENGITDAVFSPDNWHLATASTDGTARIWDARTGEAVSPPLRHSHIVVLIVFSPDGTRLATASDTVVRLWKVPSGDPINPPLQHNGEVYGLRFSPSGTKVLTTSAEHLLRVWDLTGAEPLLPPMFHPPYAVQGALFLPDGKRMVTYNGGEAMIWDTHDGSLAIDPVTLGSTTNQVKGGSIGFGLGAEISPDGTRFLACAGDFTARVWDLATWRPVTPPLVHGGALSQGAFSPDGRWVLTASYDHTARLWNATTGDAIGEPLRHDKPVVHAAFSRDGRYAVTTCEDGVARIWTVQPAGLAPLRSLRHEGVLNHAAFSPDGNRLATGSDRGTVMLWDVSTGEPLTSPLPHRGDVRFVCFSPNGRVLVSAGMDNTARIWDGVTGHPVTEPLPHSGWVHDVCFSRDGRLVMTASQDHTARIWDTRDWEPLAPPFKHAAPVRRASFDFDGQKIVTCGFDSVAQIWEVPRLDWDRDDILRMAEVQAGSVIDERGRSRSLTADELQARWQALRMAHPDHFQPGPSSREAWHRRQAVLASDSKNATAALFHLDRLRLMHRDSPELNAIRARVLASLPAPRDSAARPELIDLSEYYTSSLTEGDNNLAELPSGIQKLAGVEWDIRGRVQVGWRRWGRPLIVQDRDRVTGIEIGRKFRRLHLLHGTENSTGTKLGTKVATYRLRFLNNTQAELAILYGRDVLEWWCWPEEPVTTSHSEIAWLGSNAAARSSGLKVRVFKSTWDNPFPDVEVSSLDFVAEDGKCQPFLIALTVE